MNEIDVSKIHADKLLAGLYNSARVQGLGILQARSEDMTPEQAAELLSGEESQYFDYLHGRVMKVVINGSTLDPYLYDRDNGDGAAQAVIDRILS